MRDDNNSIDDLLNEDHNAEWSDLGTLDKVKRVAGIIGIAIFALVFSGLAALGALSLFFMYMLS